MVANPVSYLDQCKGDISGETVRQWERSNNLLLLGEVGILVVVSAFPPAIAFFIPAFSYYIVPATISFIVLGVVLPMIICLGHILFGPEKQLLDLRENCSQMELNFILLSNKTPNETRLALLRKGIDTSSENAVKMRPILAKFKCFKHWAKIRLDAAKKSLEISEKLAEENPLSNRMELFERRKNLIDIENKGLKLKMEAAFAYAVLLKGDTNYSLNTIGVTTGTLDTMLAMPFFLFKNNLLSPITQNEVKNLTVAELGQRLFKAING